MEFTLRTAHQLGRLARGGYGLPKVATRTAMPYSLTPCEQATPETVSGMGCPQGGQPAVIFYPFGNPRMYAFAHQGLTPMLWVKTGLLRGNSIEIITNS
jgi:hypothetical protein